jgi:hypothetical protein
MVCNKQKKLPCVGILKITEEKAGPGSGSIIQCSVRIPGTVSKCRGSGELLFPFVARREDAHAFLIILDYVARKILNHLTKTWDLPHVKFRHANTSHICTAAVLI